MIKRDPNWRQQLIDHLGSVGQVRFKLGEHDCATFTFGAVHAMTGWHPDPSMFSYTSVEDGYRMLRELGFDDMASYLDAHFERFSAPVFAGPGDVCTVETPDGTAFGIAQGEMIYVVGANGLGLYPLSAAIAAWRVG